MAWKGHEYDTRQSVLRYDQDTSFWDSLLNFFGSYYYHLEKRFESHGIAMIDALSY